MVHSPSATASSCGSCIGPARTRNPSGTAARSRTPRFPPALSRPRAILASVPAARLPPNRLSGGTRHECGAGIRRHRAAQAGMEQGRRGPRCPRMVIRDPEDDFRISYHQLARRLSEAAFRIAKRSIGKRISPPSSSASSWKGAGCGISARMRPRALVPVTSGAPATSPRSSSTVFGSTRIGTGAGSPGHGPRASSRSCRPMAANGHASRRRRPRRPHK
jgi:hypothetical protein